VSEAKRKRGRPQLPEGRAKTIMFSFRITDIDKRAFELAALRAGMGSASDWARDVLVRAAVAGNKPSGI
jgi:hypothetical protein